MTDATAERRQTIGPWSALGEQLARRRGQRIGELAAALGVETADIRDQLRHLVSIDLVTVDSGRYSLRAMSRRSDAGRSRTESPRERDLLGRVLTAVRAAGAAGATSLQLSRSTGLARSRVEDRLRALDGRVREVAQPIGLASRWVAVDASPG